MNKCAGEKCEVRGRGVLNKMPLKKERSRGLYEQERDAMKECESKRCGIELGRGGIDKRTRR